jgi:hypothetical protein
MTKLNRNLKPKDNIAVRIKMLLVASSLAITLGGWGILAADQVQKNGTVTQTSYVQPAFSGTQSSASPSISISNSAPRPLARTRSSR